MKQEWMEPQGYKFVSHNGPKGYELYAAASAELVIKDEKGEVLGTATTTNNGSFSMPVRPAKFYQITGKWKGRNAEVTVPAPEAGSVTLNFGNVEVSIERDSMGKLEF